MTRVSLDLESCIKMVGSLNQISSSAASAQKRNPFKSEKQGDRENESNQTRNMKNNILAYTLDQLKLYDI